MPTNLRTGAEGSGYTYLRPRTSAPKLFIGPGDSGPVDTREEVEGGLRVEPSPSPREWLQVQRQRAADRLDKLASRPAGHERITDETVSERWADVEAAVEKADEAAVAAEDVELAHAQLRRAAVARVAAAAAKGQAIAAPKVPDLESMRVQAEGTANGLAAAAAATRKLYDAAVTPELVAATRERLEAEVPEHHARAVAAVRSAATALAALEGTVDAAAALTGPDRDRAPVPRYVDMAGALADVSAHLAEPLRIWRGEVSVPRMVPPLSWRERVAAQPSEDGLTSEQVALADVEFGEKYALTSLSKHYVIAGRAQS